MAVLEDILTWKNRLLDLSKKNNLINYKDNKTTTLEILKPDFYDAFKKITSSKQTFIYDTKEDFSLEVLDTDTSSDKDKTSFLNKYSKKVTTQELLLFNANSSSKRVLRTLKNKSLDAITERGVNILYAAFGLARWNEEVDKKTFYLSPLILIPIKLNNASSNSFSIELYDDDIILNQAFKYMLKTEYNINLPEYNDEDLALYLDNIKKLLPENFSILEEARISLFSFNKLNMYLDIDNNETLISLNKNVVLLANKKDDLLYPKDEIKEEEFKKDLFLEENNVVDADFSQTEAINYALKGKSFVLQGPPGTGKSQTITNIIAELLYAGKKVLFVSEKMAALKIVYNNLAKVGLSEFLLELHSYKANKKDFVKELYDTLHTDKTLVDKKSEVLSRDLLNSLDKLNKYEESLYKVYKPINKSLYLLLSLYNHFRSYNDIAYVIKDINKYDEDKLNYNISLLEKYQSFEKVMGYDYKKHPLYGFDINDMSYEFELEFKDLLTSSITNNKNIISYLKKYESIYKVKLDDIKDLSSLLSFISFINNKKIKDERLLDIKNVNGLINKTNELKPLASSIKTCLNEVNKIFNLDILKEDLDKLYDSYFELGSTKLKRMFNSGFKVIDSKISKYLIKQNKINYIDMCNYLSILIKLKNDISKFNDNDIKSYNLSLYNSYNTNFDNLINYLNELKTYLTNNKSFSNISLNINIDNNLLKKVNISITNYNIYNKKLEKYYKNDFDKLNVVDRLDILEKLYSNINLIKSYSDFNILIKKLEENNLLSFIDKYLAKKYSLKDLTNSYYKIFYRCYLDYIFKTDKSITSYSRLYHDSDINTFIKNDEECLELARYKIKGKLSSLRPDPKLEMAGSPTGLIKREYNKTRKLMPIRKIFEEIPEFILKIKPCMLMSPLSVSTYLSSKVKFDVVIFDEASQVFPEDALVAIYRAKQLIVVGDSKQMPPTEFFMSSEIDEDYTDEVSDVDSFESILDLASSVLPTKSLLCHYRSKDESLINFSNKNFYDDKLITYPSVLTGKKDIGLDFIYVNKGVMDSKLKVNMLEAEKVVDLIFDHFKYYPNRSLGVVAFNIRQQEIISRLCQIRREKNPEYERYFSRDVKEPFFIKNLETVQGDERDTIIFSVTYAKNEKGIFNHRFGPLNSVGGERRLNVAITRAKLNVKVVSSIKASDIDVTKITNLGPKLLQDYLSYVESGASKFNKNKKEESLSPFTRDIYKFLVDNGFDVDINVGSSKYKIDLAVKQTVTKDYVLAIECDGESYHESNSARDKNRLRKRILEGMNWVYYRIWSIDWYNNNEYEKKELLVACHKALALARSQMILPIDKKSFDVDSFVKMESASGSVNIYDEYEKFNLVETSFNTMSNDVNEIANLEAPISIDYLLKKYAYKWYNAPKVTKKVKEDFDNDYDKSLHILKDNEFLYTIDSKNYSMRKNVGIILGDINYVSLYEIRNGMYQAIEYNGKCKKEDLYLFMRNQLGFNRFGDKITKRLDDAYNLLKDYIFVDKNDYINLMPGRKLEIIRR